MSSSSVVETVKSRRGRNAAVVDIVAVTAVSSPEKEKDYTGQETYENGVPADDKDELAEMSAALHHGVMVALIIVVVFCFVVNMFLYVFIG